MDLTNNPHVIHIGGKRSVQRFCRKRAGWVTVSSLDRVLRPAAEQVLNHVLPALAGINSNVPLRVEHHGGG